MLLSVRHSMLNSELQLGPLLLLSLVRTTLCLLVVLVVQTTLSSETPPRSLTRPLRERESQVRGGLERMRRIQLLKRITSGLNV